jgi:CubicO group peptidase (beta-lactamase class C family)
MKIQPFAFIASCIIVLIAHSISFADLPEKFSETWQEVETVYKQGLKDNNIVGSSLMFISQGKIVALTLYGMADLENLRLVDEQTIYHWASITKTFTGIAIMQLRDHDLLQLEDPLVKYIPEINRVHNPFGEMDQITLKHLLTHSAGFRFSTWPWGGEENWHPLEPTEWSQLVALFPYTEILFEPGSKYSYSNPGITFLGQVIERITGEDYEVYMDKNILKPLKMYRSYFDTTPYHLLPFRSNNYFLKNDTLTTNGLDFDTGITVSNGGLNAPLGDMVKYMSFLTQTGNEIYPILDHASLEEMWKPQYLMDDQNGMIMSRGLAFQIVQRGNIRVMGHTGGQRGFLSFYYVHPESGTGAILVFNTVDLTKPGPSNTRKLLDQIRNILMDRIWPLFIE